MPKFHTRQKRYKAVGATSQKHRFWKGNQQGRQRMKSFGTSERAKEWAKEQQLDEKLHELRQHPGGKWSWRIRK